MALLDLPHCAGAFLLLENPKPADVLWHSSLYLGNGHRPHPAAYMLACATQLILSAQQGPSASSCSACCAQEAREDGPSLSCHGAESLLQAGVCLY